MITSKSIDTLFSVKDKVVLVTGGGKGIGLMISSTFMAAGAKVYIASRELDAIQTAAQKLNTEFGAKRCFPIVANLGTEKGCIEVAEELGKREDKLHVLIHNAGCNWGANLEQYPDSAWNKVLDLNLKAPFHLTVKLLPLLRAAASPEDPARIIHISSINGEPAGVPVLETYAYSSSKAALSQLGRHLAFRLASENINVNNIATGAFETKMMAQTLKNFKDSIIRGIPRKRIGEPSDIGGACIFLSSRASAWITGATIAVDGGSLACAKM